jgi:hypothetical protein
MRRYIACGRRYGVVAVVLAVGFVEPASAEEEATVKAFSAWQGRGEVFETGRTEATFIGALNGMMYIETENGPLASGHLSCPAIVEINLEDGSQTGTGRCTITAEDGARAYAEVTCAGYHLIGCDGEFKLTGGTGRFDGITGGGPITIRSDLRNLARSGEGTIKEDAAGIMYWRELHYRIP